MKEQKPHRHFKYEHFWCEGCKEGFRYKCNKNEHVKKCWKYLEWELAQEKEQ